MGLFSSTKKVYVSSVAYNMAGDLADRPNYLKTVVVTSVLNGTPSLGSNVVDGYLHGPGISQRSFYRWSKINFPLGSCQGVVSQTVAIPPAPLEAEIPVAPGELIDVRAAFVDMGDISYWGEMWMLENRPLEYADDWVAEWDPRTHELVLTFPVGPEQRVSYPSFSNTKKYIFAYYTRTLVDDTEVQDLFIYEMGSGNPDLDALSVEVNLAPAIFPVIPLRLNNTSINHSSYAAIYPSCEKTFKKATGGDLIDLLHSINTNPRVRDIDYAFLVHGVELNTTENCGKHYLYQFFKSLISDQKTTPLEFANWLALSKGYDTAAEALAAWTAAQSDPMNPLYDTPRPTVPTRTELEVTRFAVKTSGSLHYQTNIGWVTIDENVHDGLGKVGAKKGDFWTGLQPDVAFPAVKFSSYTVAAGSVSRFKLFWQDSDDSYRVLNIYGMFHENFVYDGKTVNITARQALLDADTSGFVVPLHYPTLHAMPLVLSTQLALSSKILVFNCYQVVVTRWYQTGFFRFVFSVLLAVAIAVIFPASVGLLGTAFSVGASLGFTGLTAIIIGSTINTFAAMVLTTIIQKGSTELFGDKLGAVIGTIVNFLAVSSISGMNSGMPFTLNFGDIIKAENLLKLTDVFTGASVAWAQGKVGDIQNQMISDKNSYDRSSQAIKDKSIAEFGYGAADINPLMFTDMNGSFSADGSQGSSGSTQPESATTFLTRTLMTGKDIVEMSLAMVREYPSISLELPKPFT